jgi:hypothetical protein
VSSILRHSLWPLSLFSSNIAVIGSLGSLFACCIVAVVACLGHLCHCPFRVLPQSLLVRLFFSDFSFHVVPGQILPDEGALMSCQSCTEGHHFSRSAQFLPRSTISLGPEIPEDVSSTPCGCCTAGHLPAGGNQLPPGFTISSGQLCCLYAWPCSYTSTPAPLLRSRRFPCDLFRRDHLTFRSGFPFLGTLLFALQACHCGPFLRDLLPLSDVLAPALDLLNQTKD